MSKRVQLAAAALGVVLLVGILSGCAPTTYYPVPPTPPPTGSCVKQATNTTQVNGESNFTSSYASTPFTGAAIVTNAVFSNIFVWPNPGRQTWDQHLASLPRSASSSETTEVLDNITCALVNSSYFDPVTQYGIAPPVYAGDETTAQSCVDALMANASSNAGVIQWIALKDFVNCEQSTGGGSTTQVNLFFSPELKVADIGDPRDFCAIGTGAAYHSGFPGTRNYTVIPTSTRCNRTVSGLAEVLSHEMVETITDPGGFGWLHDVGPRIVNPTEDLATLYSQGEVGDICSSVGQYPVPAVPFDDPSAGVGPLTVAPYWSNADNACEPKFIMNETLATQVGSPIVRFTGQTHTWTVPVTMPHGISGQALQALEIAITTGSDDLRGGNSPGDNANVTLNLSPGQPFTNSNINESNEWGNGTLHTAFLSFPPGITVGEISSLTLTTNFGGGLSGDNWNVNGITLKAAVSPHAGCPTVAATLVNAQGNTTLPDGSIGLVRMTGSVHTWSTPVSNPGANANLLLTDLQLTVGTGGDDLRGGTSLADNANAIISLSSGSTITFTNINGFGTWRNNSTATVDLLKLNSLPANTTLGDITGITLQTSFSGGLSGDNWDVATVVLQASLGCAYTGSTPVTSTLTLLDAIGTSQLPDGSTGLVRMTGSVHTWTTPTIPIPNGAAGDKLDSLQVTIYTGNDDLRGGNQPNDNANITVQFASGQVTYTNVNQSQHWNNGEIHTVTLSPLPASATLGQLQSLTISTAFGGGLTGDNWDISRVTVTATVTS